MLKEVAKVIGLTGPMGSGKNEVAKMLRRRRFFVIEGDQIAHTLYEAQSQVWHELIKAFGSKILNRGGKINRKKLGEIVFADKRKLQLLDRIVHPYLKQKIIQEVEGREKRVERIVINAAVLKEIGLVDYVDEIWVVMASKEKRLRRLLKMGLSEKEAGACMRSQMSQKEYLKIADVVIENNGTLQGLREKVLSLL